MDNDEDDFDHDDDDYSSMLLLHRAVRCPFCREPDAFEVDRPILRPDAYAAYRKQKLEREEHIKRQILLCGSNEDRDNDKATHAKINANTKIQYYNLD
jgi:hypothetical protein